MSKQTSSQPPDAKPELEQAAEQVIKLLMSGGTIGQYLGHSREMMEELYAQGYSLYNQGKYEEAEKAFGALLICNHIDRRVYQSYAACLQMQKRYEDAIRYYMMSAAMDLTDPAPAMYCAECLLAMGKREAAIDSLQHVLEMPKRSDADRELAQRASGLLDLIGTPTVLKAPTVAPEPAATPAAPAASH